MSDRSTARGFAQSVFHKRARASLGVLAAAATLLVAGTASAEVRVSSLPYTQNFNADNYSSSAVWLTGGGRHEWVSNAGWNGTGAAKFYPPTSDQSYTGLGQYILSLGSAVPEQLNVRWLQYHGSTWRENANGEKLIILNRNGNGGRPMIILREASSGGQTWETLGACDGTVCRYDAGDFFPDGTDRLKIGNPPVAREAEWICIEFEANVRTGMIKLYIDTQDGRMSGLYIQRPMDDTGPGGTWSHVDIIGGYFNGASRADANNYFMIDELQIAGSRIGPPAGFNNVTRPSPVTGVSTR